MEDVKNPEVVDAEATENTAEAVVETPVTVEDTSGIVEVEEVKE
mgnify:FL=1